MEHQRRVSAARQNEPDVHAARGGRLQRSEQLRVRHEVGVRDQDLRLGACDGREQRHVDQAELVVGRTADCAHDLIPLRLLRRIVVPRCQRLALLRAPRFQEQLLELRDDRALDLEVRVPPRLLPVRTPLAGRLNEPPEYTLLMLMPPRNTVSPSTIRSLR